MNVNTGHLVDDINIIDEDDREGYIGISVDDYEEAKCTAEEEHEGFYLRGKKQHCINLHEKSKLANKARNIRKKKKKMSQKSRVKNRVK